MLTFIIELPCCRRLASLLVAAVGLSGCAALMTDPTAPKPATFEAAVDTAVVAEQATLAAAGKAQAVAASRDEKGVQSDFLEGILLVKPRDAAELKAFIDRVGGTIVGDDTIPQAPKELGIVLTDAQRAPTQWKVAIDLVKPDLAAKVAAMAANAAKVDLVGRVAFSSERGLQTLATLLDAKAAGFRVSASYIHRGHQVVFPTTLFATRELTRPGPPPSVDDPFSSAPYADYGAGAANSNQSNTLLAWQFVAAHGILRRTRVAILDGGFYLDPAGLPLGTDSDFPAGGKPIQYDIDFNDYFADGTNSGPGCGRGNPCFWHGTGSTGSAVGLGNNQRGGIGTGWQVADPILLRINGSRDQTNRAIRTAIAWGADVVSMSFGGDCNQSCRIDDRDDNPYDDHVGSGGKTVFVASAGNGRVPTGQAPNAPAVGYDVGADNFVHPCIEDHVICVGALNNGATSAQLYSNFGGQVAVFAPTNLPVMAYPASTAGGSPLPQSAAFGLPVSPNRFGGTSASAPFVAGVVAMMKAVNPELNHDAIAQILKDTARPGAGVVTRRIDVYAAVRRAAGASPIVKDALENNDVAGNATDLGALPPYLRSNLNIDARERDWFKFISPNGRRMTVTLAAPAGLGVMSVDSVESLAAACGTPRLVLGGGGPLAGGGRTVVYRVPGGPLRLGVRGSDVNAYNLGISFAGETYPIDDYESNNTVATAKVLQSRTRAAPGFVNALLFDPRITIDATLHTDADVDYYLVRGVVPTLAEQVKLAAVPTVKIYGNDSQITLEVFRLLSDRTQGPLIQRLRSAACGTSALEVTLDADAWFLVRVSGGAGRYTLKNNLRIDVRKLPDLAQQRIDAIIKPGDPIDRQLGFPETYLFVADLGFGAVRSNSDKVRLQLLDATGRVLGEGVVDQGGERLSLANATAGGVFALAVTPKDLGGERALIALDWEATEPARSSANLIINPGADDAANAAAMFPGWRAVDGLAPVARLTYGRDVELPPEVPGGQDLRGERLFGGSSLGRPSAIRQDIVIDASWREVIDSGRAKARLSAIVGGILDTQSLARLALVFTDSNRKPLATLLAPTIGARERAATTALLPIDVEAAVPVGAAFIRVTLRFDATGNARGRVALADELRLVLSEFTQ